jgi:Ca2+:H+ antiporter
MARANKMDLSLGIALGSSIQIVLLIAPLLVLAGPLVAGHPLTLAFTRAEVGALFLAVLVGVLVGGDGRSNWFKGVQLIGIYLLMAALFYSLPVSG